LVFEHPQGIVERRDGYLKLLTHLTNSGQLSARTKFISQSVDGLANTLDFLPGWNGLKLHDYQLSQNNCSRTV
jgi:hypothetical protein